MFHLSFQGKDVYRKVGNNTLEPRRIENTFGGIQGPLTAAYVFDGLSYLVASKWRKNHTMAF